MRMKKKPETNSFDGQVITCPHCLGKGYTLTSHSWHVWPEPKPKKELESKP
jgi:hypothetical protein